MNELIEFTKPKLPVEWNYEKSVQKVKMLIYKWINITKEITDELYIAREILSIPPQKAKIMRQKSHDKTWTNYCSEVKPDLKPNDARRVINRWLARRFPKEIEIQEIKSLFLPEGKFEVFIIDPPWPYGTNYDVEGRRIASPYPEMNLEEIINEPIPKKASDNCIIWFWTTHKFMHDAFHILEYWNFEPKIILTWVKNRMGMGVWLRSITEFCIMATKGNPKVNLTNQTTVIYADVREHSRKPDEFYDMVKELCNGRMVDWFGREKREGFEIYGNEPNRFN